MKLNYDYNEFLICNNKYRNNANVTIENVDSKRCTCNLVQYSGGKAITCQEYSIEYLVETYINSTYEQCHITNPSLLKRFFRQSNEKLSEVEINKMLVSVKEQYNDIVQALGAVDKGLKFNLVYKNSKVVFSGMMNKYIPFKEQKFSCVNKTIDSLRDEIKSWLFDTLDGYVNLS